VALSSSQPHSCLENQVGSKPGTQSALRREERDIRVAMTPAECRMTSYPAAQLELKDKEVRVGKSEPKRTGGGGKGKMGHWGNGKGRWKG
jgi:hypothetical protein